MIMKIAALLLILLISSSIQGQDCDSPSLENYEKVTDFAFAESYEECPVMIVGYFFRTGFPSGYLIPKKIRKHFLFQCTDASGELNQSPLGTHGDFFAIDSGMAEPIMNLEPNSKIQITGRNLVQKTYGRVIGTYFIVEHFELLE